VKNLEVRLLALVLACAGLALFLYKVRVVQLPLVPDARQRLWAVEAGVHFDPDPNLPPKVELVLPSEPPHFRLLRETFPSGGYGMSRETRGPNRVVVWTKRRASGRQTLFYRALVVPREGAHTPLDGDVVPPEVPDYPDGYRQTAMAFLDEVRSDSADVATFAGRLLTRLGQQDETVAVLLGGATPQARTRSHRARRAVHLLRGARIPSRVLYGFDPSEDRRVQEIDALVQVHDGSRWLTFDPVTADRGLPGGFLVWSIDQPDILQTENVYDAALEFAAAATSHPAGRVAEEEARRHFTAVHEISLANLSVNAQEVFRLLLLIPLGALIVVAFRNFVGLSTAGTFAPVLLALAFRETSLGTGIVLFVLVVGSGLGIRLYFERLQLLVVPRLAAVVTVVVLLMTILSLVAAQLDFRLGLSVALLPMVILAWIIERMSVTWEEEGPREVLAATAGTLVVASLAYLVFTSDTVQHLVFVFPELLLLVLAAMLLTGRYTGFRLLELRRFRSLRWSEG